MPAELETRWGGIVSDAFSSSFGYTPGERFAGSGGAGDSPDFCVGKIVDGSDFFPATAVPGFHEKEVPGDIADMAGRVVAVTDSDAEHAIFGAEDDERISGAGISGDVSRPRHGACGIADASAGFVDDEKSRAWGRISAQAMNVRQKGGDLGNSDRSVALDAQTHVMIANQPGDGDNDSEPIDLEGGGDVKC